MVPDSILVVIACFFTESYEVFVQICVLLLQPVIVEDYMDVMVCVLKEQEGQSCMDRRLALASRHDPDLG